MGETFTAMDMLNTVFAGLVIVFAVLMIIYCAIVLMKVFFYTIPNKRKLNTAAKEPAKEAKEVALYEKSDTEVEEEEAAAVAAVIAAAMGNNLNSFRLNKIVRR